jgi:hypothetical protein
MNHADFWVMPRPRAISQLLMPFLQLTSGHTAGSHFPNGIGESSNTVPTFSENFWSGCGS